MANEKLLKKLKSIKIKIFQYITIIDLIIIIFFINIIFLIIKYSQFTIVVKLTLFIFISVQNILLILEYTKIKIKGYKFLYLFLLFFIKIPSKKKLNNFFVVYKSKKKDNEYLKVNDKFIVCFSITNYNLENFSPKQKIEILEVFNKLLKTINQYNCLINFLNTIGQLKYNKNIEYLSLQLKNNKNNDFIKKILNQKIYELNKEQNLKKLYNNSKILLYFYSKEDAKNFIKDAKKLNLNNLFEINFDLEDKILKLILELFNIKKSNQNIKEKFNCLKINDKYIKFFKVHFFQNNISKQWSNIFHNINLEYFLNIKKIKEKIIKKRIQKAIDINNFNSFTTKKNLKIKEHENLNNKLDKFLNEIIYKQTEIYEVSFSFILKDKEYKNLIKKYKKIEQKLIEHNIVLNNLNFQQYNCFLSTINQKNKKIINYDFQELSKNQLLSFWPFSEKKSFNKKSLIIGSDEKNTPFLFNSTIVNSSILNRNSLIFGKSGSGKSIFNKLLIENLLCQENIKIFLIDPENEYKNYFNTSLKNYKYISPFDDNFIKNKDQKIMFLNSLFNILLTNLDIVNKNFLKKLISQYINENIQNTKNFLLFLNFIKDKIDFGETQYKKIYFFLNNLKDLDFLNELKINNEKLTIFNFNSFFINLSDNYILAYLFFIFSYFEDLILKNKENKNEFIFLIIDEAHFLFNFINIKNNFIVNYIVNFTKRIRKYNGGVIFISQNIKDFFSKFNTSNTETIINNNQYLFLFKLNNGDINDLHLYIKNYNNFEKISKTLKDLRVGEFLFIKNNKETIRLKNNIYDEEKK